MQADAHGPHRMNHMTAHTNAKLSPSGGAIQARHAQKSRPSPGRRKQDPASRGRLQSEPPRRQSWAGLSPNEILDRYKPGQTDPLRVLDILIELFNTQHTALQKSVSHKTQYERKIFLRRFFRELTTKGGFKTPPDPRNLGQKHIDAMVRVWQRDELSAATIQTYLSFLRGLAQWLGKPGLVRKPAFYGLTVAEYQRHEVASRDKSWSASGVDVEKVLADAETFDPRTAAMLRLMDALALRRKEAVMCRPWVDVVPFGKTGLPPEKKESEHYLWTKGKGGRIRWVAIVNDKQRAAIATAQSMAAHQDSHIGDPDRSLKQNLRRLDYSMVRLGITKAKLGVTGHGLRHGRLHEVFEDVTGVPAPVRGGTTCDSELDRRARLAVSATAGHARYRAAAAYLGSSAAKNASDGEAMPSNTGRTTEQPVAQVALPNPALPRPDGQCVQRFD